MPLRDDLLTPISDATPAGPDLRYDKVFQQIQEAREEDDESLPAGDWGRTAKKADRALVIKLAGDLLATRSKDLRVAGWYLESLIHREGFARLADGIKLLWQLQTEFWDTVHPAKDEEDSNLDLRVGAVEKTAILLANSLKVLPLTHSGINWIQYQDATAVGLEAQATTSEREKTRQEAIAAGALTGEDLKKSVDETPKAFYIERERYLLDTLDFLGQLDEFQQEQYGDDYPSLLRLKSTVEAIKNAVAGVLFEKRKTDPDPEPKPEPEIVPEPEPIAAAVAPAVIATPAPAAGIPATGTTPAAAVAEPSPHGVPMTIAPSSGEGASSGVLGAAEFLAAQDRESAVPYLLCAALRMGETRTADLDDLFFAVAPRTETRQVLRRLAGTGKWDELMKEALRALCEPCGRVWLDLQRYIWRAAEETGRAAISTAVASQLRALLLDVPALCDLMMDDDTPAANAETRQWLAEMVLPATSDLTAASPESAKPVATRMSASSKAVPQPDIFETAQEVMAQGRPAEAISMLLRDSEGQPSGRMRFLRRVQMAQLCLAANQVAVAFPMLRDLAAEIEKRTLETWETAEMLSTPLSLYLQCLVQRDASASEQNEIFERLCKVDPQAALLAHTETMTA